MAHSPGVGSLAPAITYTPPNETSAIANSFEFSSPHGLKFLHWICKLARNAREALVTVQSQLDDDEDVEIRSSTFVDLRVLAKCVANAVRDVDLLLTSAETFRKLHGQILDGTTTTTPNTAHEANGEIFIKREIDSFSVPSPPPPRRSSFDASPVDSDSALDASPDFVPAPEVASTVDGNVGRSAVEEDLLSAIMEESVAAAANMFAETRDDSFFQEDDPNVNGVEDDLSDDPSYVPNREPGTKRNAEEYVGGFSPTPSKTRRKRTKKKSNGVKTIPFTSKLEERFLNSSANAKTIAWRSALVKNRLAQAAEASGLSTLIPRTPKSRVLVDRVTGQFHCEICGAKYRHHTSLSRHRRMDHPRKKKKKKTSEEGDVANEKASRGAKEKTGEEGKEEGDGNNRITSSESMQKISGIGDSVSGFDTADDSLALSPDIPMQDAILPSQKTSQPSRASPLIIRKQTEIESPPITATNQTPRAVPTSNASATTQSLATSVATPAEPKTSIAAESSASSSISPPETTQFCDHCGITFESKAAMDKHLLAVMHEMVRSKRPVNLTESAKRNIVSKIRPKRIPREGESEASLKRVAEEEDDEVHVDLTSDRECDICGKIYCTPQYMKVHRKRVHEKPSKKHECDICHQFYATPYGVRCHKEFMHGIKKKRKVRSKYYDPDDEDEASLEEDEEEIFKCVECDKVYKHRISYQCHMKRMHSVVKPSYYQKTRCVCPFCGEERIGKYGLQKHIETVHEQKKRSKCHICNKEFSKKKSAQEHIDSVHLKLKKYACEICGNKFVTDRNLDMHIKLVHLNIRKHKCEICGHGFSRRKALEVHIQNVHQGQTLQESLVT